MFRTAAIRRVFDKLAQRGVPRAEARRGLRWQAKGRTPEEWGWGQGCPFPRKEPPGPAKGSVDKAPSWGERRDWGFRRHPSSPPG